jgi:hypothetical protein
MGRPNYPGKKVVEWRHSFIYSIIISIEGKVFAEKEMKEVAQESFKVEI